MESEYELEKKARYPHNIHDHYETFEIIPCPQCGSNAGLTKRIPPPGFYNDGIKFHYSIVCPSCNYYDYGKG